MKITDTLLLWTLKRRLKRMKKDAKWYEKKENMNDLCSKDGKYTDFYHVQGIPELEARIHAIEIGEWNGK